MLPFFIDCDPGIDDAIALGYALCQPDVEILGVAASAGNVPVEQVTTNALAWLQMAGRSDIPVHPGAARPLAQTTTDPEPEYADDTHGPSGTGHAKLPQPTTTASDLSAAQAWVHAAHQRPGELVGVVLGPCTNLALALQIEPELPQLLKRLFIMGGAFNYRGNTRPTTEWNITWDPEAAAEVFRAFAQAPQLPVVGPIEATEAVVMTPQRLATLTATHQHQPSDPRPSHHHQESTSQQPGQRQNHHPTQEPNQPTHQEPEAHPTQRPDWHQWLEHLAEALRFYFEFHEADGHGYLAQIHDPFVTAAAIAWSREAASEHRQEPTEHGLAAPPAPPSHHTQPPHPTDSPRPQKQEIIPWAQTAAAAVDVELTGTLTRGETVADWLGRWNCDPNALLIRSLDAEDFLTHLTDTLKRGPH